MGFHENENKTFTAGAALAVFRRVKLSAGKLAYSGTADEDIGTITKPAFADLDPVNVRLINGPGTRLMCASEAISLHAKVYQGANGKVAATGTKACGYALEAATADNDLIEVLYIPQSDLPVVAVAGGLRVAAGEATLGGTNPTAVVTGLTSITAVILTIKGSTTPGDDPVQVTYAVSGGTLNIYAWKNNGTDPTLVASTDNARVIGWFAVGA